VIQAAATANHPPHGGVARTPPTNNSNSVPTAPAPDTHHFVHEHDVGAGAGEDAEDLAVLPPELAQPPDELRVCVCVCVWE
jgi:hypothetical protein